MGIDCAGWLALLVLRKLLMRTDNAALDEMIR